MNKTGITLKDLKERTKQSSSKPKTSKQKRQDKIDKLESNPKLWKMLEQSLNEDASGLNKAFMKFRSIYQSGRRFSAKEWIDVMSDLLDVID